MYPILFRIFNFPINTYGVFLALAFLGAIFVTVKLADRDGLPRAWIARMKRAIRTLGWRFSADRMVMDYALKCYVPAAGGVSSDMSGTV